MTRYELMDAYGEYPETKKAEEHTCTRQNLIYRPARDRYECEECGEPFSYEQADAMEELATAIAEATTVEEVLRAMRKHPAMAAVSCHNCLCERRDVETDRMVLRKDAVCCGEVA